MKTCMQILKIKKKSFLIKDRISSKERYIHEIHDVKICWVNKLIEAKNATELNEKLTKKVLNKNKFNQVE